MSLNFLVRILLAAWLVVAPAAVAAKDAPAPAIWRIADEDTTIYLFGTIHVLEPKLKWRSRTLNRIITRADELVVESSDADFAKMEAGMAEELEAEIAVDRPPLIERVAKNKRDSVRRTIMASGMPEGMFDLLPTWMAVFALGMGGIADTGTEEAGADSTLEQLFLKAGKPVVSVEDPNAVIGAIRKLPEAELLRLLEDDSAAAEEDVPGATSEDLEWARGDVSGLAEGLGEDDLGPALYGALIRDRNAAWTSWLIERMKRPGTVLFAVGAGHLVGPDSVQTMLAARDVRSQRIDR
jgi:uncharacterized protein YbaP (TraB family)